MKVLVVGGGAREHALCWKLRQSPLLTELYCAPGNPGIEEVATLVPIAAEAVGELADFAAAHGIALTVVGPELPLTLGIADEFASRGLPLFGPSRAAAVLEGSKVFAKELMARHGIPTAPFTIAHDLAEARAALGRFGFPVVLKADGLAAGKGVIIAEDEAEGEEALRGFFEERRFGASGDRVVIERFLPGDEVSFMALSDGRRLLPLATARDYKRVGDGDSGPNTGGMGCHSPAGVLSPAEEAEAVARVLEPALAGMAAEGCPFVGVLYAGLMKTSEGIQVLEFNVRFGDPEAQVLLLRLEDDLLPVLAAGAAGRFEQEALAFRRDAAACVVLAAPGYPGSPTTGEPIRGLGRAGDGEAQLFQAGTRRQGDEIVSAGGRVLSVCALGADLSEALRKAYKAVDRIDWPGKVYRRDIGWHAV
jgi:phosphoribosylamine--glycine ligase